MQLIFFLITCSIAFVFSAICTIAWCQPNILYTNRQLRKSIKVFLRTIAYSSICIILSNVLTYIGCEFGSNAIIRYLKSSILLDYVNSTTLLIIAIIYIIIYVTVKGIIALFKPVAESSIEIAGLACKTAISGGMEIKRAWVDNNMSEKVKEAVGKLETKFKGFLQTLNANTIRQWFEIEGNNNNYVILQRETVTVNEQIVFCTIYDSNTSQPLKTVYWKCTEIDYELETILQGCDTAKFS